MSPPQMQIYFTRDLADRSINFACYSFIVMLLVHAVINYSAYVRRYNGLTLYYNGSKMTVCMDAST